MTSWIRHEDQRRDQETTRAQQHFGRAQEILTIQQEAGDNYFVVEHAPQLNRSCKGPELEITNIEKNFSPNSFEVNEMNNKIILDNNCFRYHSETREKTNTLKMSFEIIAVDKNGETTEICGPWAAIPDTGALCCLLPEKYYQNINEKFIKKTEDENEVYLIGINNERVATTVLVIMWIRIGEKEFPIKFVITRGLDVTILLFRALVVLGLIPIYFGVAPEENVFLELRRGINKSTVWKYSVEQCESHHKLFNLQKGTHTEGMTNKEGGELQPSKQERSKADGTQRVFQRQHTMKEERRMPYFLKRWPPHERNPRDKDPNREPAEATAVSAHKQERWPTDEFFFWPKYLRGDVHIVSLERG